MLSIADPPMELLVGDSEVKAAQVFTTKVNEGKDMLSRLKWFSNWITLVKVVARIKRLGETSWRPFDSQGMQ